MRKLNFRLTFPLLSTNHWHMNMDSQSTNACLILKHESSHDVSSCEEELSTRKSCQLRPVDFIRKNIKEASKVRRIEYDTDDLEEDSTRSSFVSGKSSRSSKIISPEKKMKMSLDTDDSFRTADMKRILRANLRRIESPTIGPVPETSECAQSAKSYIKQTTCQACKEKWRNPLPTPKTPKVKKASVIPAENSLCRTNSRNRISMLIHKELYTLESYNKRYSSSNSSARCSKQKEEVFDDTIDYVKLDLLELARTKLGEREEETKKKVDHFLNGPLP